MADGVLLRREAFYCDPDARPSGAPADHIASVATLSDWDAWRSDRDALLGTAHPNFPWLRCFAVTYTVDTGTGS